MGPGRGAAPGPRSDWVEEGGEFPLLLRRRRGAPRPRLPAPLAAEGGAAVRPVCGLLEGEALPGP